MAEWFNISPDFMIDLEKAKGFERLSDTTTKIYIELGEMHSFSVEGLSLDTLRVILTARRQEQTRQFQPLARNLEQLARFQTVTVP